MKKIIFIDDDKLVLDMYRMYFSVSPRKEEYQFFGAPTIKEGEDLIKREKPDLILLDLILPKVLEPKSYEDIKREELNKEYGFNLLQKFREDPQTKNTPVIILSNLSSAQDKERARSLGANEYIVKSQVVPSQVLEVIKRFIPLENQK